VGVASLIVGAVIATLAVGADLLNWLVVLLAVAAGLFLLALAVRGG
jgi:hypothetical protein